MKAQESGNLRKGGTVLAEKLIDNDFVMFDLEADSAEEVIRKMADVMEAEEINMLIGSRFLEGEGFQSTGLRRVGIRFFTWLIRLLTGQTITDPTSGMRMVDKEVMHMFANDYPKDYPEPETV